MLPITLEHVEKEAFLFKGELYHPRSKENRTFSARTPIRHNGSVLLCNNYYDTNNHLEGRIAVKYFERLQNSARQRQGSGSRQR